MTDWVHTLVQCPLSVSVIVILALSAAVSWLAVRLVRRRSRSGADLAATGLVPPFSLLSLSALFSLMLAPLPQLSPFSRLRSAST
jgi:hypothetical protein